MTKRFPDLTFPDGFSFPLPQNEWLEVDFPETSPNDQLGGEDKTTVGKDVFKDRKNEIISLCDDLISSVSGLLVDNKKPSGLTGIMDAYLQAKLLEVLQELKGYLNNRAV